MSVKRRKVATSTGSVNMRSSTRACGRSRAGAVVGKADRIMPELPSTKPCQGCVWLGGTQDQEPLRESPVIDQLAAG